MTRVHFPVALLALVIALVLIPTSVSAGSSTSVRNGNQYYEISGGYNNTSLIYPNGIVLGNVTHSGYARWNFTIAPAPPTYNLSAGLYYSETLGDGPSISLYNWTSSGWDIMAANVGNGSNVNFTTYAPSMNYINSTGLVRVEVNASIGELVDVGTVSVAWKFDDAPPSNPKSNVSMPPINNWTADNTVQVTWSGASDDVFGVAGYSIVWSQSSTTLPIAFINTTGTTNTSMPLADGIWYLHIRTADKAGNWNATAYHVGPFRIDTRPPTNPTSNTSNPSTNTWSNDTTVSVTWSGATDAGSGVKGYSLVWSQNSSTVPDTTTDTTGTGNTSSALADGIWYLHIRTVDNAGNWNATAYHVGPFKIDTVAPASPVVQGPSIWSNDSSPQFTWSAPTDPSGILGYSYSMDSSPDGVINTTSQSVVWFTLADGNHTFYVRACDQAENWGIPASYSFSLDTVLPTIGIVSPTDGAIQNTSIVEVSWTGSDDLSGIDYYEIQMDSSSPVNVGTDLPYQFVNVPDGNHTFKVTAIDRAGNQNTSSVGVTVDTLVPLTTLSIDGTMGSNDWYVSAVNVTITGSDETSGVKSIAYNSDSGGWQVYTGPIQIAGNGVHTLLHYAEDLAGNRNPVASIEIKIDTMQLYISFDIQDGAIFNSKSVVIPWTVHNALSGVDRFEYRLDTGTFQSLGTTSSVGLANLSEGSHALTVRVYDNAGKMAEQSITFIVDTRPPTLAFDIQNGTMFVSRPVNITWSSEDGNTGIDRFEYSLDGGPFESTGDERFVSLEDVSDGNHVLTVRAYDIAGNLIEQYLTFRVDTQPPALAFSAQGTAFLNSRSVAITWTASDAVSGVDRFEYSLDYDVFVPFGTPESDSLELANVSEGTHTLILRAYDRAGNLAEESLEFMVDIQSPTLAFNVQSGIVFSSRQVTIDWSSIDNNSGIDRFEYSLDNQAFQSLGTADLVKLTNLADGTHVLTIRAFDRAGNTVEKSITFEVNTLNSLLLIVFVVLYFVAMLAVVLGRRYRAKGR